ncbi:MAG: CoA transferase [Dehalococcoidia bacterium]
MARPLDGIRVIEWAMWQAGPIAGSMLGDLGAEVIKIEHPVRGDDARGMTQVASDSGSLPGGRVTSFEHANRNKRGITLDIRSKGGREILRKLVERSDVFFTNFRDSVVLRAQLDYETLLQYNPRLIYGIVTGYGSRGPDSDKRSFDIAGQGRSGMMFAMGDRDMVEPTQMQGAPLDQLGGTMLAYAILAALVARERTGKAQKVESSILGSGIHLYSFNVNSGLWRGRPLARHSRARSRNAMANYYRCADGKWLMLAEYQSDRFWHDLCQAIGIGELENHPHYATAVARAENYAEVIQTLDRSFATKTRDEWLATFKEKGAGYAYEIINEIQDLASDQQVLDNEYITEFDHPTMGRVKVVGSPVLFDEQPLEIRPAPQFGEHTEEVLLEVCGYDWEDIGRFKEEGAI